jgi:hypothetical protein
MKKISHAQTSADKKLLYAEKGVSGATQEDVKSIAGSNKKSH